MSLHDLVQGKDFNRELAVHQLLGKVLDGRREEPSGAAAKRREADGCWDHVLRVEILYCPLDHELSNASRWKQDLCRCGGHNRNRSMLTCPDVPPIRQTMPLS